MTFISVDLEMAIAYWNIVLKDRFRFLDIWCQFLQVSLVILVDVGDISRRTLATLSVQGGEYAFILYLFAKFKITSRT